MSHSSCCKDRKLNALQNALQQLRETEQARVETVAQYKQVETIVQKQFNQRLVAEEVQGAASSTNVRTSQHSLTKPMIKKPIPARPPSSRGGSRAGRFRVEPETAKKFSQENTKSETPQAKKSTETVSKSSSTSLKNTTGDANESMEAKRARLMKRVQQYRDSVAEIKKGASAGVNDKKKFLLHLSKMNLATWTTKLYPGIAQLENATFSRN